MYNESSIKDYIHVEGLSRQDIVLIVLGANDCEAKTVASITKLLVNSGERNAKVWNVATILNRAKRLAIKIGREWELTELGINKISELGVLVSSQASQKIASDLRKIVEQKIQSETTKNFVLEAIGCHESSHHRAAVVLSWIGAASLLYEYVFKNNLTEFNAEAKRRDAKWRDAKSVDDFTKMKEHDFLQVTHAISVIGKSVKTELEQRLKFRNGCGHPNSLKIADSAVASHIEILILNVFEPFGSKEK